MQQSLLPLFPLQLVLLPGTPIALHIFEERYKEMIGESIERKTEFGIVLATEKGIANTGCTAVVQKVVNKYSDGRMDIVALGRRRFEILTLDDEKSYLRGAVEFFDDLESDPASSEIRERALEGYRELMNISEKTDDADPSNELLSFQIGDVVSDLDFRQVLLATRSEAERIKQLADHFPSLIDRVRRTQQVKTAASSNGHSHWPKDL